MPRTSVSRTGATSKGPGTARPIAQPAAEHGGRRAALHKATALVPAFPDPGVARMAVAASAELAERLGRLSFEAAAEIVDMNRRWLRETGHRLAALARPPERPEDVVHGLAGLASVQGDLATQTLGRSAALVQRVQIESFGALAEAGRALADETSAALHGRKPGT